MSNKSYTGNEGVREQPDNLPWIGLIVSRSLVNTVVSLGASATKLPTTPLSKRRTLLIMNNSGDIIYLGNSTVTTANGLPIYPHVTFSISIEDSVDLYGISSNAGGSDIRLLEGA